MDENKAYDEIYKADRVMEEEAVYLPRGQKPLSFPNLKSQSFQGLSKRIIPPSEAGKGVSKEEYWESYFDHEFHTYEWNQGVLEEKPVSDAESYAYFIWMVTLLKFYLETNPIANPIGMEMGIDLDKVESDRRPDFGLVLKSNPIALKMHNPSIWGLVISLWNCFLFPIPRQ